MADEAANAASATARFARRATSPGKTILKLDQLENF
jgi:hypothetical protein